MSNNVEGQIKAAMQASLDHLKGDLKGLRTGRANAGILDKVQVELYGAMTPLKAVGTVTVPEPRMIVVTPFDPSSLQSIAKGIEVANLGVHPIVDGRVVRVPIPPPDESLRKQIAKQCKDLGEKSKIALREIRRKFNEVVRKDKTDGKVSEDQLKKLEKQIQDLTDRFCKEIDQICTEKEKEIMTV
ncbi:MAG TPA: ribosome recycling factor [Chlamydiales bacterium]|nr:ribosome recycling factor [Chlamydiales bacterium]